MSVEESSGSGTVRGDIWSQFRVNFAIHIKELNAVVLLWQFHFARS